jgi:uncharacterized protein DUF4331
MNTRSRTLAIAVAVLTLSGSTAFASSHQDAPLVVLDPAANTTDVYAFVDQDGGQKKLVVALGVYPFEEPGIGPNKFNFDDNVLYEIHVALGADRAAGASDVELSVSVQLAHQESEHDAVQLYRRDSARERRRAELRADLYRH